MKIIKWVAKKMNAVKNSKKVNNLPFLARIQVKIDRNIAVQETSILACKDFTGKVEGRNEKNRGK